MYSINNDLKEKINRLNNMLVDKYRGILSLESCDLRNFIERNVGPIIPISKLSKDQLLYYSQEGGIVGVDGSNNRMGGAYPHFVEVYQGLAKSTLHKDDPIFKTDIYTPLYSETKEDILEEDGRIEETEKNKRLSTIELEVALEGIKKFKPYALLMDGGFIRYNIYSYEKWMELRQECEKRGILLVGVIKDIKTSIIGDKLREDAFVKECFYDRELLFGLLNYGEIIAIKDDATKKAKIGYSSIFMRSSLAPSVIGMDILDSQRDHIEEMAKLIFTLTPENSRGVPLWLDMVDKEVKISDAMMRGLMERYMNRDIYERFFLSERDKRTL
jgi:hypothetical protein